MFFSKFFNFNFKPSKKKLKNFIEKKIDLKKFPKKIPFGIFI
jgi:hypothetical protein